MESGTIIKDRLDDGKRYEVYVPENVNEDTPILVYTMGAALDDSSKNQEWQDIQQALIENNSDTIVIFPNHQSDCNNYFWTYPEVVMEMVNDVKETYGTNTTNIMNSGWSSASSYAVRATIENIENNPDIERQTIFLHDGFIYGDNVLKDEEIDILEQNDTIIISYAQEQNWHQISYDLVESDLDILYITDATPKNIGYWSYHSEITTGFFKDGLFDSLVDSIYGGKPLELEGYKFQIYNKETKQLEEINPLDIPVLFDLDLYKTALTRLSSDTYMTVKSDNLFLNNQLNTILNTIKNSTFIKDNYDARCSFESTSQVPSQIPSVVSSFFDSSASLLMKLTNDIKAISNISESYEEIDKLMTKEAEEIAEVVVEDTGIVPIAPIVDIDKLINPNTTIIKEEETKEEVVDETRVKNDETTVKKDETIIEEDKNKQEDVKPTVNKNNIDKSKNDSSNTSIQNNNQNIGTNNNQNNHNKQNNDFPKYEEVYSDKDKIVYNCDDKYKIIIYKDGDKITGIEHYYDFGNKNDASKALYNLKTEYSNQEHFDKLIHYDRYVKVTFDESSFKDLTLNDIKERYSHLQEVVRN